MPLSLRRGPDGRADRARYYTSMGLRHGHPPETQLTRHSIRRRGHIRLSNRDRSDLRHPQCASFHEISRDIPVFRLQRRSSPWPVDSARAHPTATAPASSRPQPIAGGPVRIPYPPMAILSDDQVEAIHHALQVLRDIGVNFCCRRRTTSWPLPAPWSMGRECASTRPWWRKQSPPSRRFCLHARNLARSVDMGGNTAVTRSAARPTPGRRAAGARQFRRLPGFSASERTIERVPGDRRLSGGTGGCADPYPPFGATQANITLTESPLFGYSLGRRRILDVIEMTRIARGIDIETLMAEPCSPSSTPIPRNMMCRC